MKNLFSLLFGLFKSKPKPTLLGLFAKTMLIAFMLGVIYPAFLFSYEPAYNPANFTTAGTALRYKKSIDGFGTVYELTKSFNSRSRQAGAVWNNEMINLNDPFDIRFFANFGEKDIDGGDGMTFVFHANTTELKDVIGDVGAGIGFTCECPSCQNSCPENKYIHNSLGIEFDTFEDDPTKFPGIYDVITDQSQDHISFFQGNNVHSILLNTSGDQRKYIGNIEDGLWHCIRIKWDPSINLVQVYFDDVNTPVCSLSIDLQEIIGYDNVYWGVTSATSGVTNLHKVSFDNLIKTAPNAEICYGDKIQLITSYDLIEPTSPRSFVWSPTTGLSNPNIASPFAQPQVTTEYTVSMYTNQGVVTDRVKVTVKGKPRELFQKRFGRDDGNLQNNYPDDKVTTLLKTADCGYLMAMQTETSEAFDNGVPLLIKTTCDGNINWKKMFYRNYYMNGNRYCKIGDIDNFYTFSYHDSLPNSCGVDLFPQKNHEGYLITGNSQFYIDASPLIPNQRYNLFISALDLIGSQKDTKILQQEQSEWLGKGIFQSKEGSVIALGVLEFNHLPGSTDTKKKFFVSKLKWDGTELKKFDPSMSGDGTIYYYNTDDYCYPVSIIETHDHDFLVLAKTTNNTILIKLDGSSVDLPIIWAYKYILDDLSNLNSSSLIETRVGNQYYYYIVGDITDNSLQTVIQPFVFRVNQSGGNPIGLKFQPYGIYNASGKYNKIIELNDETLGIATDNQENEYSLGGDLTSASIVRLNKNIDMYVNYDSHIYHEPNGPIAIERTNNIIKLGPNGYASLLESDAYSATDLDGLLVTTMLDKDACYDDQLFSFTPITIISSEDQKNLFDLSYPQLTDFNLDEVEPDILVAETGCNNSLCYCDKEYFDIQIEQGYGSGILGNICTYHVTVTKKNQYGCPSPMIGYTIEGISGGMVFPDADLINTGDAYSFDIIVNGFEGTKRLQIQFIDAYGNILCIAYEDITCFCECKDYLNENKFDIKLVPITIYGGNCCFELRMINKLKCPFKGIGIDYYHDDKYSLGWMDEIEYFESETDWEILDPVLISGKWKESFMYRGIEKLTYNPNGIPIGRVCFSGFPGGINEVIFKIHFPDEDPCYVWNEWPIKVDCSNHKCPIFPDDQIFVTHLLDDDCHYQVSFASGDSLINVKINLPNVELPLITTQSGGLPFTVGNNTIDFYIPEENKANVSPYPVEVEFIDYGGNVMCKKDVTLNAQECIERACFETTYNAVLLGQDSIMWAVDIPADNIIYSVDAVDTVTQSVVYTKTYAYDSEYPWDIVPLDISMNPDLLFSTFATRRILNLRYYGKDRNVLCTKLLVGPISPWHPIVSVNEGQNSASLVDQEISILKFYNVPNPSNEETSIYFQLDGSGSVRLELMDTFGNKLFTVYDGMAKPGNNAYKLKTSELVPGVYFIRLKAGNSNSTIPIVIVH